MRSLPSQKLLVALLPLSLILANCGGGSGDATESAETTSSAQQPQPNTEETATPEQQPRPGIGGAATPGCDFISYESSCPKNPDSQYPEALRPQFCSFGKLFLNRPDGDINFTSYFGEDSESCYPGEHNGFDLQTADIAGLNCAQDNCPAHEFLSPVEGRVVRKDDINGAVILATSLQNSDSNTRDNISFAVLHMEPDSFAHLNVGNYIYIGEPLGIQSDTGNVTGPHGHIDIGEQGTDRVHGNQSSDPDALSPTPYLQAMTNNLNNNLPNSNTIGVDNVYLNEARVSTATTMKYDGEPVTLRAEGTGFTPSTELGLGGFNCRANKPKRGNDGTHDFVEVVCNSLMNYEDDTTSLTVTKSTQQASVPFSLAISIDSGQHIFEPPAYPYPNHLSTSQYIYRHTQGLVIQPHNQRYSMVLGDRNCQMDYETNQHGNPVKVIANCIPNQSGTVAYTMSYDGNQTIASGTVTVNDFDHPKMSVDSVKPRDNNSVEAGKFFVLQVYGQSLQRDIHIVVDGASCQHGARQSTTLYETTCKAINTGNVPVQIFEHQGGLEVARERGHTIQSTSSR